MAWYIQEFLYRGHAPGSTEVPAWHVIVKNTDTGVEKIFNMRQAVDLGWPLPALIAAINTDALKAVDDLTTQLAACQAGTL